MAIRALAEFHDISYSKAHSMLHEAGVPVRPRGGPNRNPTHKPTHKPTRKPTRKTTDADRPSETTPGTSRTQQVRRGGPTRKPTGADRPSEATTRGMSGTHQISPLTTALGVVLRTLRTKRRWSQTQLAAKLGMHVKTYATYEQGSRNITLPVLSEICKKLRATTARVVAMAEALATVDGPACPTDEGTGVQPRTRNRRTTANAADTG